MTLHAPPFQGYHRYLGPLFSHFCASPWMCHSVLMEFNHQWNMSRAVENRGMSAEIGGFSQQHMVDQIQRLTASWYPAQPLYSEWLAPADFKDSGERTGLAASVLTFDGKPTGSGAEDCLILEPDDGDASSGMDSTIDERLPAPQMMASARHLASLMNFSTPITPVSTPAEKEKFRREWIGYFRRDGGASSRDHQRVDFSKWATDWNLSCRRIELGQEVYSAINRKTAGQLQGYYTKFKERANIHNTVGPVQQPIQRLSSSLRQSAPAEDFIGTVGVAQMPAPDLGLGGLLTCSAPVAVAAAAAAAAAAAGEGGRRRGRTIVFPLMSRISSCLRDLQIGGR